MKYHTPISWNELITNDVEGAKKFYGELFGWDLKNENVGDRSYTVAKSYNTEVAGIMQTPESAEGLPPQWGAYVTVEDVDASANKVIELGGTVLLPAKDVPGVGRLCVVADPQGATISLISYSE